MLGEHTRQVLTDLLGYDPREADALIGDGVALQPGPEPEPGPEAAPA